MISVKEFRKGFGIYSTGIVEVLYWDMILFCDVVIFKSRDGVFIKIPQRLDFHEGKKINILFWASKEISNAFQDEVKSQLAEKFPDALVIPDLNRMKILKKNHKKNLKLSQKPSQPPEHKIFKDYPPQKARSQSKFHNK